MPVSGNGGYVVINGLVCHVVKWTRQPANRKDDTTDSSTGGWQRKQGTLNGWQGTIEFLWEPLAIPSALGVIQNALVTLGLKVGATAPAVIAAGPAILDGPSETSDSQNGVVKYSCTWESVGAWNTV